MGVRRPRRSLRFTRDEELVRLVRAGDEAAFEVLFDRHHRGILSFCRHMVSSREEAEDAVQHTFAAAYRDLVGSDKPIQLKAWLYTIARNRCLSILRARKEQVSIEDAEPATEGLSAEVQRRQDLRDMLADLARLPEDQRAALVLSELGALSHDEIGVTLGVRKDKVKALVFQAREALSSSRDARDADCQEIQEQLSVLRGGALRRTQLRRHVEICPSCAAFKAEVQRQRTAMACLLPVVPSTLLRDSVMAAAFGGGGVAAGGGALTGGGGLLAGLGAKGLAAKVAAIAVVAGGATGGGLMAVDELSTAPADAGRQSLAALPEEAQSVRLVSTLRQRAREAAVKRARDAAGGGSFKRPAPANGATPAGGARPASNETSESKASRGPKARADRSVRTRRKARKPRPTVTPAVTTAPAAPVAPAAAPVQQAPTAAVRTKSKPKKPKRGRQGPKAEVPVAAPPASTGDGKRGRGHEISNGKGHAKHGDPVPTAPAPPPAPSQNQGHGQGQGQGPGDKPKKDKLVTELHEAVPVATQDEPAPPAPAPGLPPVPVLPELAIEPDLLQQILQLPFGG